MLVNKGNELTLIQILILIGAISIDEVNLMIAVVLIMNLGKGIPFQT